MTPGAGTNEALAVDHAAILVRRDGAATDSPEARSDTRIIGVS